MAKFTSMAGLTGTYRITLDGEEPVEVQVIAADILRWEQVNSKSFFEGEISFSRMAWVGWAAMRRQKLTVREVADYMRDLVDLESQGDDSDEDEADEEEGDGAAELPPPFEAGSIG